MSPIDFVTIAVVHVTLLPVNLFPLAYSRSPWRSTSIGQALMWLGVSLAALYDVGVLGFWWPFPGYAYIYCTTVTGVGLGIAYECRVLLRLQRQGRHTVSADGEF